MLESKHLQSCALLGLCIFHLWAIFYILLIQRKELYTIYNVKLWFLYSVFCLIWSHEAKQKQLCIHILVSLQGTPQMFSSFEQQNKSMIIYYMSVLSYIGSLFENCSNDWSDVGSFVATTCNALQLSVNISLFTLIYIANALPMVCVTVIRFDMWAFTWSQLKCVNPYKLGSIDQSKDLCSNNKATPCCHIHLI